MYEYAMRFSDYLENGMKMLITLPNGFTFSWHQVYVFDIVASLLISVIVAILYEE